jgi:hypothetical protein
MDQEAAMDSGARCGGRRDSLADDCLFDQVSEAPSVTCGGAYNLPVVQVNLNSY